MRRIGLAGALGAALVLGASAAGAQTWVTFSDGSIGFQTPYSFSGRFTCGTYPFPGGATCVATPAGIRLLAGTATIDLSFAGASGTLTATSVIRTIPVGTLTEVAGGTGSFVFPGTVTGANSPMFFALVLTLAGSGPMLCAGYATGPASSVAVQCGGGASGSSFAVGLSGPEPGGFHYTELNYQGFSPFTIGQTSAAIPLTADVGISPEPSSVVLLATGLLPLVPAIRRRRAT